MARIGRDGGLRSCMESTLYQKSKRKWMETAMMALLLARLWRRFCIPPTEVEPLERLIYDVLCAPELEML